MSNEKLLPDYQIHDVGDIQTLTQIYPQNVRDLNVPKIWSKTKGKGVLVLVLDTGCPYNHPDLNKNVDLSKCKSFIPGEDIFDIYVGHGTHVSGTIGATDNAEGIVGIAPEVTIVTAKVLDRNGRSNGDSILKGLEYAIQCNADVVNMSLGGSSPMPAVHEVIKKLTSRNIPVICSAGNNGQNNVLYPAQYDECIAVGSYSDSILKDRSIFSSWGDTLDIMAPGEKILSTFLNGSYSVMSGTSMAAPVVSGVVALLISFYKKQNKVLTVEEIKKLLYTNALDVGEKGKDQQNGWGILNPESIFGTSSQSFKTVKFIQKVKNFFGKLFRQ
jgi:major intracellular serine protease